MNLCYVIDHDTCMIIDHDTCMIINDSGVYLIGFETDRRWKS